MKGLHNLSAKYGLLGLQEEIENYDVTLGGEGSVRLEAVREQVEKLGLERATVTVLGGEKYVKGVRQIWPDAEAPLTGAIGQQLQQLSAMCGGDAPENDVEDDDQAEAGPKSWYRGSLHNVPNLPVRGRSTVCHIWFGGKASKKKPEPGPWHRAGVTYTGEGKYEIYDLGTSEVLHTCKAGATLFWTHPDWEQDANTAEPEAEHQDQDQVEDQVERPAPEWQKLKMTTFVSWGGDPRYFRYGGLAKHKPQADGPMVRVRWAESRHGDNQLVDVYTNEVVALVHSASNIWAVPATDEEIAAMPPLVKLPDSRPDYSLPPEEREEPWARTATGLDTTVHDQGPELVDEEEHQDDEIEEEATAASSRGVLLEGWLGAHDPDMGWSVWNKRRTRIVGWLSDDHKTFTPEDSSL
ncbi:DUF6884 domain-containing protein [Streptomyces sp. NPDC058861]|uniref:DUF6884 domain-containing protein n=1 Tax=Streptomyces sp. NPDC058861 TaxID=3346653 RepID=UPI0036800FC0